MKVKKLLVAGLATGLLFLVLDMAFAIATMPLLAPYASLPIWNNPPNVAAGAAFDFINGFMLVWVFALLYNGLPGKGMRKGMNYGAIVGLFRVVMGAFSTIVMYSVPLAAIAVTAVSGYLEIVVLCMLMALVYEKMK